MKEVKNFKSLPLVVLIPNLFTLLSLAIGTNAIRLAIDGNWEIAVGSIIVCALLDGLDGRIARILEVSSKFGAELDSLCDFVSFGITPAIVLYLWIIDSLALEFKRLSWTISIIYILCMAIRLARFNVNDSNEDNSDTQTMFFTGVPAPAGGLLLLLPLMLNFNIAKQFNIDLRLYMQLVHIFSLIVALLLASRIPTYSIKNIKVKREFIWLVFFAFGICIIAITLYPWNVLPLFGLCYIVSIAFSIVTARKIN